MKRATSSKLSCVSLRVTIRLTTLLRLGFRTVFKDLPTSVSRVVLKKAAETVAIRGCPERASPSSSVKDLSLISIAVIVR